MKKKYVEEALRVIKGASGLVVVGACATITVSCSKPDKTPACVYAGPPDDIKNIEVVDSTLINVEGTDTIVTTDSADVAAPAPSRVKKDKPIKRPDRPVSIYAGPRSNGE